MNATGEQHRAVLQRIARRVMVERGLLPDFSAEALTELGKIQAPATASGDQVRDLRDLLWASIDNDDSRDLDQLTVAAAMPGDKTKILVAVADVDSVVRSGSAIDVHARHNTTSVYTAATIFPMLPEKLSTDITSLGFAADRLAIVVEMVVGGTVFPRNPTSTGLVSETGRSSPTTASRHGSKAGRRRQPSLPCPGWTRTCGSRTGRRKG